MYIQPIVVMSKQEALLLSAELLIALAKYNYKRARIICELLALAGFIPDETEDQCPEHK